jgi:hypothetical protein
LDTSLSLDYYTELSEIANASLIQNSIKKDMGISFFFIVFNIWNLCYLIENEVSYGTFVFYGEWGILWYNWFLWRVRYLMVHLYYMESEVSYGTFVFYGEWGILWYICILWRVRYLKVHWYSKRSGVSLCIFVFYDSEVPMCIGDKSIVYRVQMYIGILQWH